MNKSRLTSSKAYITYFVIATLLISVFLFRYLDSFVSNITFNYDSSLGSISLHSDGQKVAEPAAGQEIRLKKGDYLVRSSGKNIAQTQQKITIDGRKTSFDIDFSYTSDYLGSLYDDEQLAIYTAMLLEYPKIDSDYSLSHEKLYGMGDWFGATLVYNDQQADNRDSLRLLMQKSGDGWQVISKPPTPVLSAPNYPDVPYEILKAINQAE